MQAQGLQKAPLVRTLAQLMGMGRDYLTKADTVTVAAIEAGVPGLAYARSSVNRFQTMVRTKAAFQLDGWIEQVKLSLIAPLARSVAKDVAAIRAAMAEPWSNGRCMAVQSSTCYRIAWRCPRPGAPRPGQPRG